MKLGPFAQTVKKLAAGLARLSGTKVCCLTQCWNRLIENAAIVFLGPPRPVCLLKFLPVVDFHGDFDAGPRSDVKLESGIGVSLSGQNRHYCPIAVAKATAKGLFIGEAW